MKHGLTGANIRRPTLNLLLFPIAMLAMLFPLDWLLSSFNLKAGLFMAVGAGSALVYLYFGWRYMYLISFTETSDRTAKGKDPDFELIDRLTE